MDWSNLLKQQLRVAARSILNWRSKSNWMTLKWIFFDLRDITGNRFGLQPIATKNVVFLAIVCLDFSLVDVLESPQ
jgi:hypothetical protein